MCYLLSPHTHTHTLSHTANTSPNPHSRSKHPFPHKVLPDRVWVGVCILYMLLLDMEANSSSTGDHRLPMEMEMDSPGRKGFHPRDCSDGGVKLFGVRLGHHSSPAMMLMRKTVSMGNLSSYNSSLAVHAHASTLEYSVESGELPGVADPADPHGYVSDCLVQNSGSLRERKKGVPWTEDEHRMFLMGLEKLGKGDWRGIARTFVPSRTPTQVASHAQKYFLRQKNLNKRKRRSSLFDMISSNPASTICNAGVHVGSCETELNFASATSFSADLCLGLSDETHREQQSQVHKWCQKFSAKTHSGVNVGKIFSAKPHACVDAGTQLAPPKAKLLSLTLNSLQSGTSNGMRKSPVAMHFSSVSATSSSSSSSLPSLCRIDEAPELLNLSIGPPLLSEQPLVAVELTLKLEQPSLAMHPSIGGSANNSSAFANAIRVV